MSEALKSALSRTAAKVGPVVHLTTDNLTTLCGTPVGAIVAYRAFSDRPCSCCVKKRLE